MPQLTLFESEILESFYLLSRCRQLGFGCVGGISISDIVSLLDVRGVFDFDSREEFLDIILRLDKYYLEKVNDPDGKTKRDDRDRD